MMDLKLIASLALEEVMDADPKPIAPKADPFGPKPGVDPLLGGQKGGLQNLQNDLAAHDRRFHPQGYKKGDTCKYREKLAASGKMPSLNLSAPAAKPSEPKEQGGAQSQGPDPIRQKLGDAEADSVASLEQIVAAGGEKGQKAIAVVRAIYEKFPEGDARREAADRILRSAPLPKGDDGDLGRVDETVIAPHEWPAEMTLPDSDDEGRGRWRGAWKWLKDKMAGAKDFTDWDRMENRWGSVSSNTPTYRADMTSLQDGLMDGIGDVMGMRAFGGAMKREGLNDAQKAYITSLYEAWAAANESTKHRHLNQLVNYLDRLDRAEAKRKAEEGDDSNIAPSKDFSTSKGDSWSGNLPDATKVFDAPTVAQANAKAMKDVERKVDDTLKALNIDAIVSDIVDAPTVTTVTLEVADDTKASSLFATEVARQLNLALGTNSVKMSQRPDGKLQFFVRKEKPDVVQMGEAFSDPAVVSKAQGMSLPMVTGKDANGNWVVEDLAEEPHQLISGATGSGKSVDLNGGIASMIALKKPSEVGLFIIDGKGQEFPGLDGLPHLIHPVVNGVDNAEGVKSALLALQKEITDRRRAMSGYKSLKDYNRSHPQNQYKPIMAVIDEYAALQDQDPSIQKVLDDIGRIARSVGVHMRVATQAPNKRLMNDLRSHFPTQHVYLSADKGASLATLGDTSGTTLGGKGDGYVVKGGERNRIRGTYVSNDELGRLVEHYTGKFPAEYKKPVQGE